MGMSLSFATLALHELHHAVINYELAKGLTQTQTQTNCHAQLSPKSITSSTSKALELELELDFKRESFQPSPKAPKQN